MASLSADEHGWVLASLVAAGVLGQAPTATARVEAGARIAQGLDAFLFGESTARWGGPLEWQAGAGAKLTF